MTSLCQHQISQKSACQSTLWTGAVCVLRSYPVSGGEELRGGGGGSSSDWSPAHIISYGESASKWRPASASSVRLGFVSAKAATRETTGSPLASSRRLCDHGSICARSAPRTPLATTPAEAGCPCRNGFDTGSRGSAARPRAGDNQRHNGAISSACVSPGLNRARGHKGAETEGPAGSGERF